MTPLPGESLLHHKDGLRICYAIGFLLLAAGLVLIDTGQHSFYSPILFSTRVPLTSAGVALACAGPLFAVCCHLRRGGCDYPTIAMYIAGALLGLNFIHVTGNTMLTNDMGGHIGHTLYMSSHWLDPFGYGGVNIRIRSQAHHPPLYYYAAGLFHWWADRMGTIPRLLEMRFLGWICMLAFNAFGLKIIQRAGLTGAHYYITMLVFLCFPATSNQIIKINNEALFYPLYAASFYYALCWFQDRREKDLQIAFIFTALAFMAKSNAVILIALLALFILIAWSRQEIRLRMFLSLRWLIVAEIFISAVMINYGRALRYGTLGAVRQHYGGGGPGSYSVDHFTQMNFMADLHRTFTKWELDTFWDCAVKTMLFGEYKWHSEYQILAGVMVLLFILLVLYAVLATILAPAGKQYKMLPFMLGTTVPLAFIAGYVVWKHTASSNNFRYVYQCIPCLVAWYGLASSSVSSSRILTALSFAIALGLVISGTLFFWYVRR